MLRSNNLHLFQVINILKKCASKKQFLIDQSNHGIELKTKSNKYHKKNNRIKNFILSIKDNIDF